MNGCRATGWENENVGKRDSGTLSTYYHRTGHLKMVKMLCVLYHNTVNGGRWDHLGRVKRKAAAERGKLGNQQ